MSATPVGISKQAEACLHLHLIRGIGPHFFARLIEHFETVDAVLAASAEELQRVPGFGAVRSEGVLHRPSDHCVAAELKQARSAGVRILCRADGDYPELLQQIPDAPVCLYVQGPLDAADRSAVAIVGSRHCTHYGQEQSYVFATTAARCGLTVVSGLARGIDTQAHLGALDGGGRTIAVLGSGLGKVHQHHNAALAQRILDGGGCLISELPMQTAASAELFPPRNRIIAGLSLGTIVIEAARRSGALITARLALEYNREVFAVPGRVDSGVSAGTHQLIREGQAKITSDLHEVLAEFSHAAAAIEGSYEARTEQFMASTMERMSPDERCILDVLTAAGTDLEHICASTGLPPEKISHNLTLLQLKGVAHRLPGNRYARR